MANSVPPHVSLSLAAARLRLALRDVQDLVRAGRTSGTEWIDVNARQALAEQAWRAALKAVRKRSIRYECSDKGVDLACRFGGE
jgi:hypothetical protein